MKESWTLGFMTLVCSAESEFVLLRAEEGSLNNCPLSIGKLLGHCKFLLQLVSGGGDKYAEL